MNDEQGTEQTPQEYAAPPDTHIVISGLRKVFKRDEVETVALEDFSLDIKKGELITLVGPSGCGKTTILRLIAGLIQPTSGEIRISGRPCTAPGADRGMVFQDFALFPWRSVRKNVEFGLEVAGVPKEERRERAEKYIKLAGLEKFIDARVHELSGGMKQRVGIARALVGHPDVILMDEPFGALDAQTRNIMQVQLLNILEKTDQTIIFVTHSVDEAVFLSDRIVVLTKRPASIKEIIDIPWPRPRDRACLEFTALRKKILTELEKENVMND
ncbi:MAG: ABC transporter ATP-binding protein [Methanomassiliicoccaceae archaeon]|nr:ABC transporter ATP-binding protein [Methanomassiliicoccaceae archaeon]